MSSIVKAINLSFKSFSRLYLAERFSLKEEGKSGFSFGKGLVTPAGSREALENEAETKSFQHGLSSCPTSMSPMHTRAIWMFGNQASIGNSTEGSAWPPQRTLVSHPGEMPPQFSCHQGAPVRGGGAEPGLHASVPPGGADGLVGCCTPVPPTRMESVVPDLLRCLLQRSLQQIHDAADDLGFLQQLLLHHVVHQVDAHALLPGGEGQERGTVLCACVSSKYPTHVQKPGLKTPHEHSPHHHPAAL